MTDPAMFTKHCFWIFCAAALTLVGMLSPPSARAQTLRLVARFSTFNGTVYFLPGAWVSTQQNDQSTYYRYEAGKFVRATALPKILRGWKSFSWGSVDFLNQISIQNYDPGIDQFLPKQKRVKKVEEMPLRARGKDLVLVCFTEKTSERFAEPGDTDIYLSALTGKEGESGTTYKLLWTRKVETDASYGNFELQEIPRRARFAVLYWADMGGSGGEDALNVYRVTE